MRSYKKNRNSEHLKKFFKDSNKIFEESFKISVSTIVNSIDHDIEYVQELKKIIVKSAKEDLTRIPKILQQKISEFDTIIDKLKQDKIKLKSMIPDTKYNNDKFEIFDKTLNQMRSKLKEIEADYKPRVDKLYKECTKLIVNSVTNKKIVDFKDIEGSEIRRELELAESGIEKMKIRFKLLVHNFKKKLDNPSFTDIAITGAVVLASYTLLYAIVKTEHKNIKFFKIVDNVKLAISMLNKRISFAKKILICVVGLMLTGSAITLSIMGINKLYNYISREENNNKLKG